jgi:uncharacterized protein (TIGR00288 family)
MKDIDTEKKIAVLIDAENASYNVLGAVLTELSKHGHIIVKKAYGDWSSKHLVNWKTPLNELAINPVQQFSYTQGKNSSDAAMIIDAMDLLYTNQFDAFALVTSDSDFTKLASRLKESQIYVFGVGESKTPAAFRNACDDFILTEVLTTPDEEKTDRENQAAAIEAGRQAVEHPPQLGGGICRRRWLGAAGYLRQPDQAPVSRLRPAQLWLPHVHAIVRGYRPFRGDSAQYRIDPNRFRERRKKVGGASP